MLRVKMVNNSGTRRSDKVGDKQGTERQKLADELSFLASLISKHKEKPAVKKSDQNTSGHKTSQFSWTKKEPVSSSQSATSSDIVHKKGQRSHNPHHLPTKESLTWKKPKEGSDLLTTPATTTTTRYKYVAKDVHRLKGGTAVERSKNVSCSKGKVNVCKEGKTSAATSLGRHPVPNRNAEARRIVIPQGENNVLLKSDQRPPDIPQGRISSGKPKSDKPEFTGKSGSSEAGILSGKPIQIKTGLLGKSESVNPQLHVLGSSSEYQVRSNSRRVVLPTSRVTSGSSALKSAAIVDTHPGLSRIVGKETIPVKPSASVSIAQTGPQKRPSAKVLATLSKELDKCLGDIARLKGNRSQVNHSKINVSKSVPVAKKAPCTLTREANSIAKSKINATLDGNQKVGGSQASIIKTNDANKKQFESNLEKKNATGRSAIAAISDYKWVAPKVDSAKLSSRHGEEFKKTKAKGADNLVQKKTLPAEALLRTGKINLTAGLKTSRQISSPQVNVIRTKYKIKKQLSTPSSTSSTSSSLISRHKIDHRKAVSAPAEKSPVKTYTQKNDSKTNRYKFVKSSSHPGVLSLEQPSTSSLSPQKTQVVVNSRYKKVKGYPTASGSPKKPAIVIPHRSQLKLNRTKPKPPQRNATKRASLSTTTRKQSMHKIDRRPGRTSVVRSRFKMRKVSKRTPRKAPPKQSSNSSPFKWQAKKLTPPKPATPDTFMRRRIRFVLTHTPVLLRTRFRLINSQHNNSAWMMGHTPKQPLLKKTRTKLVRKSASTPSSPSQKHSRSRVVNAKGVHYHQSRSGKSLRRISGSSPVLSSSAYRTPSNSRFRQGSLSRVWTASAHKVYQRQGATKVSSTQWVANRALGRTIQGKIQRGNKDLKSQPYWKFCNRYGRCHRKDNRVRRRTIQGKIQRGNKDLKSQPYCKFYNRYGRCHRKDKCPYIHDPDKVAVCTQFLRGTCKKTDGSCPFSHKVSKDKMPVCVYFLKGVCNRDDCPYSHVKVSRKAEVCQEFLHGYCPRGAKCKKKHTLDCAEFNETGQCKLGNKCPLWHRGRRAKNEGYKGVKRKASESEKVTSKRSNASRDKHTDTSKQDAVLIEKGCSKANDDDVDASETDDRSGSMPSFIALDSDSNQSTPEDLSWKSRPFIHVEDGGWPALKIRPLFASSMGVSSSHQGRGRDSSSSSSSLLKPSVTTATGCSSSEEDTHPSSGCAEFTTPASSQESAS